MKKIVLLIALLLISFFVWKSIEPSPKIMGKALHVDIIAQQNYNWCWAAGIQMFLKSYDIPVVEQIDMAKLILPFESKADTCHFCTNSPACNLNISTSVSNDCYNTTLGDDKLDTMFQTYAKKLDIVIKPCSDFKWDTLKSRIDNKNVILLKYHETDSFYGDHYVLITGYLETNGFKLMMAKDPWLPCKGSEYLMNFEKIENADSVLFIYPKVIQTTKLIFENGNYFNNPATLLQNIVTNDFLHVQEKGKPVGHIVVIYTKDAKDTAYINSQKRNPDNILIYNKENPDFTTNALCVRDTNGFVVHKVFFSTKYNLLCCGDLCKLSETIEVPQTDENGEPITENNKVLMVTIEINPTTIFMDKLLGIVIKQYEVNGKVVKNIPVATYTINNKPLDYRTPIQVFEELNTIQNEMKTNMIKYEQMINNRIERTRQTSAYNVLNKTQKN